MISNFTKYTRLVQSLSNAKSYAFASFPTTDQQKTLFPKSRFKQVIIKDDLAFPQEHKKFNGGIEKMCEHYKKNTHIEIEPVNAALMMYNCGKHNVFEPVVFEEIERHLPKFEDNMKSRWAFGCLYGAYKTNASTLRGIKFFQNELVKNIEQLTPKESAELIYAMSFNAQLSDEQKFSFLKTHLQPILVKSWKKMEHEKYHLFMLFQAIHKLQYFDKEFCELIFDALKARKSFARGTQLIEVYETLSKIQASGSFYRDLSADIQFWREKLQSKDSVVWRYDIENMKWFTYQELKTERENYKFPDQVLKTYTKELTEEERLKKEAEEQEKEVERQEQEREKRMNDIVKERYQLIMRGDMDNALREFDEEAEEVEDIDMEFDSDEEEGVIAQSLDRKKREEAERKLQKEKLNQEKKLRKALLKTAGGPEKEKKKDDEEPEVKEEEP